MNYAYTDSFMYIIFRVFLSKDNKLFLSNWELEIIYCNSHIFSIYSRIYSRIYSHLMHLRWVKKHKKSKGIIFCFSVAHSLWNRIIIKRQVISNQRYRKPNRHPTNCVSISWIENIQLMLGAEIKNGHFSLTYKKRMHMVWI